MRACALAALTLLAACSEPGPSRTERIWTARQMAADPPELWSIEVVPAKAGWPAVTVCATRDMRAGFARPLPAVGAAQCEPLADDARQAGGLYTVRCDLNGRRFGVSSVVRGDLTSDFTASYQVTDLAGFISARTRDTAEAGQVRRYRRLGACPAGWQIGDRTDRHGRKLRQGLIADAR